MFDIIKRRKRKTKKHKACKDCLILPACNLYVCMEKFMDTTKLDYMRVFKKRRCLACNTYVPHSLSSHEKDIFFTCDYCETSHHVIFEIDKGTVTLKIGIDGKQCCTVFNVSTRKYSR